MTDEELKAIRARATAATPGEWKPVRDQFQDREHRKRAVATWVDKRAEDDLWIVEAPDGSSILCGGELHAKFVARARADVPALCDALEAARAEAAQLREALKLAWRALDEGDIAPADTGAVEALAATSDAWLLQQLDVEYSKATAAALAAIEGQNGYQPFAEALAERDARVRREVANDAADLAEDWTCKRCDSDTASDLAMAIRQLAVRALAGEGKTT